MAKDTGLGPITSITRCLRCDLPMAPTREAWWADKGEDPTYCRCAYPLPSEDGKTVAPYPKCYVQRSP